MMMMVYKVVHAKDNVETVYLAFAESSHDATSQVLEVLYESSETALAICKRHGCSVSAAAFTPDPPYKLYTFDRQKGELL